MSLIVVSGNGMEGLFHYLRLILDDKQQNKVMHSNHILTACIKMLTMMMHFPDDDDDDDDDDGDNAFFFFFLHFHDDAC